MWSKILVIHVGWMVGDVVLRALVLGVLVVVSIRRWIRLLVLLVLVRLAVLIMVWRVWSIGVSRTSVLIALLVRLVVLLVLRLVALVVARGLVVLLVGRLVLLGIPLLVALLLALAVCVVGLVALIALVARVSVSAPAPASAAPAASAPASPVEAAPAAVPSAAAVASPVGVVLGLLRPVFPPAVLSAVLEAGIQVDFDGPPVDLGLVEILHRVQGALGRPEHHKAEPRGRLVVCVQPHDHPLDSSTLGEDFVDLLLGRVQHQVPDVDGGRRQRVLELRVPAQLVLPGPVDQVHRRSVQPERGVEEVGLVELLQMGDLGFGVFFHFVLSLTRSVETYLNIQQRTVLPGKRERERKEKKEEKKYTIYSIKSVCVCESVHGWIVERPGEKRHLGCFLPTSANLCPPKQRCALHPGGRLSRSPGWPPPVGGSLC